MNYNMLPALNALLNATSAVLLITGRYFIARGRITAHRACMTTAFGVSTVFLISYLVHHAHAGVIYYQGHGLSRAIYMTILTTHTILAILIVPLVLRTLYLALQSRFSEHQRWARWTFPIWLYVSITGVVIYEMLY